MSEQKEEEKEILICDNHIEEYPTPLIGTMAFRGCELWCPYCGEALGMFDGGTEMKSTKELESRIKKYKKRYDEYLHACAVTYASGTKWKGEIIEPINLPDEEKRRLKDIRENDWKPNIKIEEIKKASSIK